MKKINPSQFKHFVIVGRGWSLTLHNYADAVKQWVGMDSGIFYGVRCDDEEVVIDERL